MSELRIMPEEKKEDLIRKTERMILDDATLLGLYKVTNSVYPCAIWIKLSFLRDLYQMESWRR